MSECEALHFTISGEALTECCRSLVLEGDWIIGYRALVDSMVGLGHDD